MTSHADFMARAYALELEASERYAQFADQLETHNNPEVAKLFRKLAERFRCRTRDALRDIDVTLRGSDDRHAFREDDQVGSRRCLLPNHFREQADILLWSRAF